MLRTKQKSGNQGNGKGGSDRPTQTEMLTAIIAGPSLMKNAIESLAVLFGGEVPQNVKSAIADALRVRASQMEGGQS